MIQALEYYWLAVIVTCVFAIVVSYIGVHLVSRKQSLILIPQSQMTVISILIGILFFHEEENLIVILFSFILTLLAGVALQRLGQKVKEFSSEWMLGLYFVLMAIGHSLTRIFPALESHFHQSFQGDVVTAGNGSLSIALVFIILLGSVLMKRFKLDKNDSFEISIGKQGKGIGFNVIVSLVLTLGVYLLGSAFTVGFLILPSLMISQFSKNYKQHVLYVLTLSLLSSATGFLLSLEFSYFATTPTMILSLILFAVIFRGFKKITGKANNQAGFN